jgi:hypothetical protein
MTRRLGSRNRRSGSAPASSALSEIPMGVYKTFKMDEDVQSTGIVLDYGDGEWVKIARAGGTNKEYLKAMERFGRKYRKQIQLDALPEEVARDLFYQIYADTIVLEFNVTDPSTGKPFPPGKESCLKMFRDLPDFFQSVKDSASELALFRENVDDISSKNSVRS